MEFVWYFLLLGFGASPSVDFRDKFQKKKDNGVTIVSKNLPTLRYVVFEFLIQIQILYTL